jgi:xylan 1,4-beta-xylosidase
MRQIPYGRQVRLTSFNSTSGLSARQNALASGAPTAFAVVDMKLGRVALRSGRAYVSVARDGRTSLQETSPGPAQSFQWIETPTGELVLMSLASHRFLRIDPKTNAITADGPGPVPDGSDGPRVGWS